MKNPKEIDLHWILTMIRRWWRLIAVCTLLAGAAAFWVTSSKDPSYEATATLLVSPGSSSRTSEYTTLVAGEKLALTYNEMLKSKIILETVIAQLGLPVSPNVLANKIRAVSVSQTQLIRLTVKDKSPQQAAHLANTIAEVFTTYIQSLQSQRYTQSLDSVQDDMRAMLVKSQETQAQIDALNSSKVKDEARLANLQTLIGEQRDDYRSLEREYQNLKLSIAQQTDTVKIAEPAQVPSKITAYPFQATTTLLVGNASYNVQDNQQLIDTYIEMLVNRDLLETAAAKMGLDRDRDLLELTVNANQVKSTRLIRLNVLDNDARPDPQRAVSLVNTIAEIFINNVEVILETPYVDRLTYMQKQLEDLFAQIQQTQAEIDALTASNGQIETESTRLQTLLADQRGDYQSLKADYEQMRLALADATEVVTITEPAQVPDELASSGGFLYIVIAMLAGALLSLGSAFSIEYMNDTVRTSVDVDRLLGLPLLGTIGQLEESNEGVLIISRPLSPEAEAFRVLAANLRYLGLEHPLHTLLVTSANPQEGKSLVTANLSTALAMKELRVVAVDADLRRPSLHHIFGFPRNEGLTNTLLQRTLDGQIKQAEPETLKVLTSGELPPNPSEIVGSSRMCELLEELQRQADMVVIDCPPVLPVADATLLAQHVDGVLVVLHANRTSSRAAVQTIESLRKVGAQVVGVVLNATPRGENGPYYYYSNPETDQEHDKPKNIFDSVLAKVLNRNGKKHKEPPKE